MRRLLLALVMLCGAASAQKAQTVEFHFERAAVAVTAYTFRVHEDGSATYSATIADGTQAVESVSDQRLRISAATTAKIFALAKEAKYFNVACASKLKVADTGAKTLSYSGPEKGSCTYNYSEKKSVESLTQVFQAMEQTLEDGRRMTASHRFDRLALDAEMIALTNEMKAGQAIEPGLIADVLRSLADDTEVLERVRSKAAELLGAARAGAE